MALQKLARRIVVAIEHWKPPNPMKGVTTADMEWARHAVRDQEYRADARSPQWFGFALAERLHMDTGDGDEPKLSVGDKGIINAVLRTWIKNGVLATEDRTGDDRHEHTFFVVGRF
jgi:hypothetical protein